MRTCRASSPSTAGGARGFTLIELLVVVGIISLLVTMVMPTLTRARELARQAVCLANHRSIVNAVLAYDGEWGTFPYNYADYGAYVDEDVRWALGCISPHLGGPAGVVDLRGRDEGEFPRVYVCPSADLSKVYLYNPNDKYHACYWTSIAIRVNRGFAGAGGPGLFDTHGHQDMPPGWDVDSGGEARVFGTTCPRIRIHWRSLYQPTLESVPLPDKTVFSGCTNNRESQHTLADGSVRSYRPGHWDTRPGWGYMHGCLSFDRHADRQLMSYLDGSAKAVTRRYLEDHFTRWGVPSGLTGDFLIRFTSPYTCRGTGIHVLRDRVVE